MKRKLLLIPMLAVLLVISLGAPVLADDPTTVDINWDGGGWVGMDVNTGDAHAGLETSGDHISGSYSAVDSNNDPYGYGVDNFSAYLDASVENGLIATGCERTNSAGMYGSDGQKSWSFVGVDNGSASMAYRTITNFAQMRDCSYGYQLSGGHNIVVSGASYYEIARGIDDGRGNSANLHADGDGSAVLDCMSAEASGCWSLQFGKGCGCYTDANFSTTGTSGAFSVGGTAKNGANFAGMGLTYGAGSYGFSAGWSGSFNVADYSVTVN